MQFLKTFLASLLGTILGITLLILILFAALASSSSEPEPYIRSNTVLSIKLSGDIPARADHDPLQELLNPGSGSKISVASLKNNLKKAAAHDNIAGVWVNANNVTASWASLESVYEAFEGYKESGKFLYFSTDDIGMNEKAYMLATLADSVFYNPETIFQMQGFVAQVTMYKGMLDKIGVEPEMMSVGRFKSVIEPYMFENISDEYRLQINGILNQYSSTYTQAVSRKTGKTVEEINQLMNTAPINRTEFAYENGLIDVLAYEDEVENLIKMRIGLNEDETLRTVSHGRYTRVSDSRAGLDTPNTSDKIAVIYAAGNILPQIAENPFGQTASITSQNFKKQIDAALEDDDIKSIVIHINSPGGAATTSDLLWRHVKRASDKKPVVASMGSVAASGGYYMAAGADTIVAQTNTITGSIGTALMIFNANELLTENMGLNFETIKTHEYADLFDLSRPLSEIERNALQQDLEASYESFLNVVAEARGMSRDEVHEVAQGRVYTGTHAKDIGLVDVVGDLDKALEIAAEMANIEEYNLEIFPKREDFFQQLFGAAETQMRSMMFGWIPKDLRSSTETINHVFTHKDILTWTLLPITIDTN